MTPPSFHLPDPVSSLDPVTAVLSGLGHVLSAGVASMASWAFAAMTQALLATTQVRLTGWFDAPWRAMLTVAGVLAVPILLAGVVTEVAAGRPAMALRRGLLLPLLIGPVLLAARALLALLLSLVDGACALVVQVGIGGPAGFAAALDHLGSTLGVTGGGIPGLVGADGPVTVLLVLATGFLSFVIWIELAMRAALIYLLVAFIPLALAGLFWAETARWTRRLLEVLLAVVLSQLVITVVLVLAAAALTGHGDGIAAGIDQTAIGLALLFLGTLGLPMTFRLIPHVMEAGVAAGTGAAVAGRVRRHTGQALTAIPHPAAQAAGSAVNGHWASAAAVTRTAAGRTMPAPRGATGSDTAGERS